MLQPAKLSLGLGVVKSDAPQCRGSFSLLSQRNFGHDLGTKLCAKIHQ